MTVGINVSIHSNVGKMRGFYASFVPELDKTAFRSTKEMATAVADLMRQYAPSDTGALKRSIKVRKVKGTTGVGYKYSIDVANVPRWGSEKSNKARKVYPWAQESRYARHWVKRTWMPKGSRTRRAMENKDIMWARPKKATPFARPALLTFASAGSSRLERRVTRSLQATNDKFKPNQGDMKTIKR